MRNYQWYRNSHLITRSYEIVASETVALLTLAWEIITKWYRKESLYYGKLSLNLKQSL